MNLLFLPASFNHAGDVPFQRKLPEADSAYLKFAQIAARPATSLATIVAAHFELRLAIGFCNQ